MQTRQGRQGDEVQALDRGLRALRFEPEVPRGENERVSVDWLARRFGVDLPHAERVGRIACQILNQMGVHAKTERQGRKLQWAAKLHEIGIQISHSDYHKHGAYILENTDMTGFTVDELHRLGLLVLGHRGKLRKLDMALSEPQFVCQLLVLRLAVILCHARRDPQIDGLSLSLDERYQTFHLTLPKGWAALYPQSAHLLHEESSAWQKTAWGFVVHNPEQN